LLTLSAVTFRALLWLAVLLFAALQPTPLTIFPLPGLCPVNDLEALVSSADLLKDPLRGLVSRIPVRVVLLG
jgi:hypothetical protein